MKTEHTPGPWVINESKNIIFIPTSFGNDIVCTITNGGHIKEVSDANARLIAAAPEMLEALKEAKLYIDGIELVLGESAPHIKKCIDEAINKATKS